MKKEIYNNNEQVLNSPSPGRESAGVIHSVRSDSNNKTHNPVVLELDDGDAHQGVAQGSQGVQQLTSFDQEMGPG